jgi:Fe-Mn family superoxide dismutase
MKKLNILIVLAIVAAGFMLASFQLHTAGIAGQAQSIPQDHGYQLMLADNGLTYPYAQKTLNYGYDALEPYIDKATMEIHYSKHHAAYTQNFNKAIEENNLKGMPLFEIFNKISSYPAFLRNNSGGYYNHLLFWQVMGPSTGGVPSGRVAEASSAAAGPGSPSMQKGSCLSLPHPTRITR